MQFKRIQMHFLIPAFFLALNSAWAITPKRNLLVEFRQVEEQSAGSYSVGDSDSAPMLVQTLMILNGEKASFRLNRAMSLQWVQGLTATGPGNSSAVASAQPPGNGSVAFNSAIFSVEAGQTLAVRPTWSGNAAPATVEVEIQNDHLQQPSVGSLPDQGKQVLITTVQAPLGYWIVIGRTAPLEAGASYRSGRSIARPISWQVRVQIP